MGKIEGSELVAQAIAKEGVDVLFGLPGGPIVELSLIHISEPTRPY